MNIGDRLRDEAEFREAFCALAGRMYRRVKEKDQQTADPKGEFHPVNPEVHALVVEYEALTGEKLNR